MAHTYRDIPAAGTTIYIELGYTYTEIPGCSDISWDGVQRGVREPKPLSATAKQKKPGMMDWGEVKSTVYYDPNDSTHQVIMDRLALSAAAQGAALDAFRLEWGGDGYATPANVEFTGFISSFSVKASDPETGTVEADMTITLTGAPTINDGSPAE